VARARSPNRDKAKRMWLDSGGTMKLKDIAAELGVSDSQIRKWKNEDGWDAELNRNVTNSNSNVTKQKRSGAPKGNKNAVGHGAPPGNQNAKGNRGGGAPPGNKNAVTTGEYESLMLDLLDDEEKERFAAIPTDPLVQIDLKIRELSWRERRMMQRIKEKENGLTEKQRRVLQELRKVKDAVTVHDDKTGQTKVVPVQREELVTTEIEETEFRAIDDILNIEEALTRVTDKLLKAIKQKHEMLEAEYKRGIVDERLAIEKEKLHFLKKSDQDEQPTQIVVRRWTDDRSGS
jgi:uncharacterized protein YjcR